MAASNNWALPLGGGQEFEREGEDHLLEGKMIGVSTALFLVVSFF